MYLNDLQADFATGRTMVSYDQTTHWADQVREHGLDRIVAAGRYVIVCNALACCPITDATIATPNRSVETDTHGNALVLDTVAQAEAGIQRLYDALGDTYPGDEHYTVYPSPTPQRSLGVSWPTDGVDGCPF